MKTNKELVAYAKAQLGKPYWFGTFGQISTDKLLAEKSAQYPKQFSAKRIAKAKEEHLGNKVHDCYGLFKGFLMSKSPIEPAVYDAKYDISADKAFSNATEKGTIDTLPEIEGIGLWKKNHFGIYIGNGREIEARGFDYGIIEDDVANTKFTHWFKMPEIEYGEQDASQTNENAPVSSSQDSSMKTYIVKAGDSLSKIAARFGVSVKELAAWNKIENPNLILVGQELRIVNPAPSEKEEFKLAVVTTKNLPLNIRKGSSKDSAVLGTLPRGSEVKIAYETGGWGKLYGREGFVCMTYIAYK